MVARGGAASVACSAGGGVAVTLGAPAFKYRARIQEGVKFGNGGSRLSLDPPSVELVG
jgi:hypothetical protein